MYSRQNVHRINQFRLYVFVVEILVIAIATRTHYLQLTLFKMIESTEPMIREMLEM